MIFPKLDVAVEVTEDKRTSTIKIKTQEEKKGINKVEILLLGEKIKEYTYDHEETEIKIDYLANQNGKYTIKSYGELMTSKTVSVEGIFTAIQFEPDGDNNWKKSHTTKVTIQEIGNKIVKAKYQWLTSVTIPEDDVLKGTETCTATTSSVTKTVNITGLSTGNHNCMVKVYDAKDNTSQSSKSGTTKLYTWDTYNTTSTTTKKLGAKEETKTDMHIGLTENACNGASIMYTSKNKPTIDTSGNITGTDLSHTTDVRGIATYSWLYDRKLYGSWISTEENYLWIITNADRNYHSGCSSGSYPCYTFTKEK